MLKVTTWNVNGVRARARDVLEWVQRKRPDVLCLQEIKAELPGAQGARAELRRRCIHW